MRLKMYARNLQTLRVSRRWLATSAEKQHVQHNSKLSTSQRSQLKHSMRKLEAGNAEDSIGNVVSYLPQIRKGMSATEMEVYQSGASVKQMSGITLFFVPGSNR